MLVERIRSERINSGDKPLIRLLQDGNVPVKFRNVLSNGKHPDFLVVNLLSPRVIVGVL